MDKTNYSPAGIWDVIYRHGEPRYVVEHDGKGGWWGVCQPDNPEDAFVLAASKDLLAAAKLAMEDCCDLVRTEAGDALEAAIKKAEGR